VQKLSKTRNKSNGIYIVMAYFTFYIKRVYTNKEIIVWNKVSNSD